MSESAKYTSIKDTYRIGKEIARETGSKYDRALVLFIVAFLCQGLAYLTLYPILQRLFSGGPVREIWMLIGIFAVFSLINSVCRWFAHDFDYTGTLAEVTHDLRVRLGNALRTIPLERLNRYKTGDLNASLSSNVDESVSMMGMVTGMFLDIVITPSVVVIGTFFIDWRIALIMLVMMPLAIPLYQKKRKSGIVERTELAQANAELESDIIEYIQGLPVLRATNQAGANAKRLDAGIMTVRNHQRKTIWQSTLLLILTDMLIMAALILVAVAGSYWVGNASLGVAAVASVLIMISRLMEPLSLFLAISSVLDIMSASFTRVKEVLTIQPLPVAQPEQQVRDYGLQFDSVDFRYFGNEDLALKNFSANIPPKAMTAIVGPSGSGKTTVTKMMMRYADPQAGTVCIGGADIRYMTQEQLLSHFAVVFQDVYLFDESILENIRMAKPSADDQEVMDAARAAYCHEFISRLPEGYQTRVGDIGGSLSGGERQRISIARAILKEAPIVILDEPTAALDTESELAVQKAIDALVKDKTIIVIAHRLSTIAGADQILVVDQGKLVESGKHRELLAEGGRYNDLWQAQLQTKAWHLGEDE